jgi:hypothetical protein
VRNWPQVKSLRGAERRYPNALRFDSPAEAAELIAAAGSGATAKSEARQRFDQAMLLEQIASAIRGKT